MKYDNSGIRRQDRLMEEAQARTLLQTAEYGVLSMTSENGEPYGIPVNFVWDGQSSIYIHCAPQGRKLRAIAAHPEVSFCIVGRVNLMPGNFTTEYESIVCKGTARAGLTDEEKMKALHLLIDKLSADFKELGDKYAHKSFHRVDIIRIDFTEFSGKCKRVTHPVQY
jgi:nitroimidazol reductase NimA-like FMN-containing flavoprotein (pyridoxamine 5'-phosphate oxidase superfamily)